MKPRTILTRSVVLLAFFALVVVLPPPAMAQLAPCTQGVHPATLTIGNVGSPSGAITPISGTGQLSVPYEYAPTPGAYSIEAVLITLTVSNIPSWASVVPASQQVAVIYEQAGEATGTSGTVNFAVTVEANAPAFQQHPVSIAATATAGTCVESAEAAPKTANIQPGFYELWQARFGQAIHKYGQNTNFQIPLVIDNSGNGRIEVSLTHLKEEGQGKTGMDVVVPGGRHQVGSEAQGQAERSITLPIDVQTPFKNGYMNDRIPMTVEISGRSADQHDILLTPAQLRATITTQGVYVPGFEAVFALVALLGVAVLQVHRRQ